MKKNLLFVLVFIIFVCINSLYANQIQKGDVINYNNVQWLVMDTNNKIAILCPYYNYQNYFQSSDWGWFYNAKCISLPLEQFEPKQKQQQANQQSPKKQELTDAQVIKLATNPKYLNHLTAPQFKELYQRVTDIAVMRPIEENISAYVYMTNFTRVKALIFSHAVVDYTMENPKYNMIKKLGETSWSYVTHNATQMQKQKQLLNEHKGDIGLIVFIKNGCPYCEKQLPVLNWFQSDYGISVIAVSLDSCPGQTNGIECITKPQAFSAYKIEYEPTMVLVIRQPDGKPKFEVVGVGLTDETTLFNRVYSFVNNYYYPNKKYSNENLYQLLEAGE